MPGRAVVGLDVAVPEVFRVFEDYMREEEVDNAGHGEMCGVAEAFEGREGFHGGEDVVDLATFVAGVFGKFGFVSVHNVGDSSI